MVKCVAKLGLPFSQDSNFDHDHYHNTLKIVWLLIQGRSFHCPESKIIDKCLPFALPDMNKTPALLVIYECFECSILLRPFCFCFTMFYVFLDLVSLVVWLKFPQFIEG